MKVEIDWFYGFLVGIVYSEFWGDLDIYLGPVVLTINKN